MKYYKLLKDLPTFKAGDLFYINPDQGCLVQKDTLILAYAKRTLDKFPNILTDWFEEIEESKNKRWRAEYGEGYWYVSDGGYICRGTEDRHDVDDHRFLTGNYFKTRKEAEAYKEYLLARQVLLDDADGGKFVLIGKNLSGDYNDFYRVWNIHSDNLYRSGVIYFQDEDAFRKSLKEHEEQWKIVRKYEMGEM